MKLPCSHALISLAVLVSMLASCTSAARPPLDTRYPFHVAIAPIDVGVLPSESAAPEGGEEHFALQFDQAGATRALVEQLERDHLFTRVSPLTLPAEQELDPDAREHYLVDSARRAGADLLLTSELRFERDIKYHMKGVGWLNVPTWLFLGPVSWFVPDYGYQAQVVLSTRLLDLSSLDRAQGRQQGPANLDVLTDFQIKFEGATYNLVERANSIGSCFVTIVWPPMLWSRETKSVAQNLERDVLDSLSRGIAERLASEGERVVVASRVADCFVVADQMVARRFDDGVIEVSGPIYLSKGNGKVRLESVEVIVGDHAFEHLVEQEPRETSVVSPSLRADVVCYEMSSTINGFDRAQPTLRLRTREQGTTRDTRTFTIPIEAAAGPCPHTPIDAIYRHEPAALGAEQR